jgi:antitoxin MazE
MKIGKWGNSLAVRLPKAVVDALDLKEDDEVTLTLTDPRTMRVERTPDRDELLARLRKYRGLMPKDFKFDRDEANARE